MKKTKKIVVIACIVVALLIIGVLINVFYWYKIQGLSAISFENKTFYVEVADDWPSRELWLMHRESLGENKWMLFVFPEPWIHAFWMKNTLIPLDMIWITETDWEYRVVDIKTAQPCKSEPCEIYTPSGPALFVLEINAWLAKWYGISSGDLVYIDR